MTNEEAGQPGAPGAAPPEVQQPPAEEEPDAVVGPVVAGPSVAPAGEPVIGRTYEPSPARETVRGALAMALVAALIAVVRVSLAIVWFKPDNSTALVEVLQLILAPLVGLVGAATGFYYGTRQT